MRVRPVPRAVPPRRISSMSRTKSAPLNTALKRAQHCRPCAVVRSRRRRQTRTAAMARAARGRCRACFPVRVTVPRRCQRTGTRCRGSSAAAAQAARREGGGYRWPHERLLGRSGASGTGSRRRHMNAPVPCKIKSPHSPGSRVGIDRDAWTGDHPRINPGCHSCMTARRMTGPGSRTRARGSPEPIRIPRAIGSLIGKTHSSGRLA